MENSSIEALLPTDVPDDPALLELMLADLAEAPAIFQPTPYWQKRWTRSIVELRERGLKDFRRREDSALAGIGTTDPGPGGSDAIPYGLTLRDLQESAFRIARMSGTIAGARRVEDLDVSVVGNPVDVFEVGGRRYSMLALRYYLRYAYCNGFVPFERHATIAEIGPGLGRQVEVLKKLHPHLTFLLFDIPPFLYITEQFLSRVFPGDVVSYRDARQIDRFDRLERGRIYILGNYHVPRLQGAALDLLWAAATFGATELPVVESYLAPVRDTVKFAYLLDIMDGYTHGKIRQQTSLDDYRRMLEPFDLLDCSPAYDALGRLADYSHSFWARRT
ncbi:MAG: putative sugar O-methyltransferase [Vicinamibacterales bacterium]